MIATAQQYPAEHELRWLDDLSEEARNAYRLLLIEKFPSVTQAQMDEFKARLARPLPPITPRTPLIINDTPNWEEVVDLYSEDRYKFCPINNSVVVRRQGTLAALIINLRAILHLNRRDTIRASMEWATMTGYKFSLTQIQTAVFDLEQGSFMDKINSPEKLWSGLRWDKERNSREETANNLSFAIDLIKKAAGAGSWTGGIGEQSDLARRNINKLEDGWRHCQYGAYWYEEMQDEGLSHIPGAKTFFKSAGSCGTPACPFCCFIESQKEVAAYDHEAAYGTSIPVLLHLTAGPEDGPKTIKEMARRWVKKRSAKDYLKNTCGAFIPTSTGYELQIMLPAASSTPFAIQELTRTWSESGDSQVRRSKKKGTTRHNNNRAYTTYPNVPASTLMHDLTVQSERQLFLLTAQAAILPSLAWTWYLDWTGTRPGIKGMNRIWHGPGFREFKIADLLPTMDLAIVDGKSAEEEEGNQETKFPRSHFSLETKEKRGQAFKIYSPFNGLGYVTDVDLSLLPPEYKKWKPGDEKRDRQIRESNGKDLVSLNPAYNYRVDANVETGNVGTGEASPTPGLPPRTPLGDTPNPVETGNLSSCLGQYVLTPEPAQAPIKSAWGVEIGTVNHLPIGKGGIPFVKPLPEFVIKKPAVTPAINHFPAVNIPRAINTTEIANSQIEQRKSATAESMRQMSPGWDLTACEFKINLKPGKL